MSKTIRRPDSASKGADGCRTAMKEDGRRRAFRGASGGQGIPEAGEAEAGEVGIAIPGGWAAAHPDTAPGARTSCPLWAPLNHSRAAMNIGRPKRTRCPRSGPSVVTAGAVSGCARAAGDGENIFEKLLEFCFVEGRCKRIRKKERPAAGRPRRRFRRWRRARKRAGGSERGGLL